MAAHDYPCVDAQAFLVNAKPQAFDRYISIPVSREYIHPFHNSEGDKISTFGIVKAIGERHEVKIFKINAANPLSRSGSHADFLPSL